MAKDRADVNERIPGVEAEESYGNDKYVPVEEVESVGGDETEVENIKFSGGTLEKA